MLLREKVYLFCYGVEIVWFCFKRKRRERVVNNQPRRTQCGLQAYFHGKAPLARSFSSCEYHPLEIPLSLSLSFSDAILIFLLLPWNNTGSSKFNVVS